MFLFRFDCCLLFPSFEYEICLQKGIETLFFIFHHESLSVSVSIRLVIRFCLLFRSFEYKSGRFGDIQLSDSECS